LKRALVSVYDKKGIVSFVRGLIKHGIEIIATDGTSNILKEGGIQNIKRVSDITDFPEILEGRVKTEHPKLIGGILALRNKEEHLKDLARFGIELIDMVVCNLYPFQTLTSKRVDLKIALENIDIGGPNMIRAAAKNFENVVVVVNPHRYDQILWEIEKKGDVISRTRRVLAVEAFKETARYETAICKFLEKALLPSLHFETM
jgi:phosphoribosylaminoimidazolecarboxamide formyltransferase/IMP cyclohydrolase